MRPTSENKHTKGAETWTPQKKNNSEWRVFIFKQTHFIVNNDMEQHGNALTYDLVRATVSKSEKLPEDGKVGPKHVVIDVIIILF
jgi:hypothetical protein